VSARIKFTENYNADDVEYKKGQEYDVEDSRAAMYVKSGIAKAADAHARQVVDSATTKPGAGKNGK
jgi:hypothetical protein